MLQADPPNGVFMFRKISLGFTFVMSWHGGSASYKREDYVIPRPEFQLTQISTECEIRFFRDTSRAALTFPNVSAYFESSYFMHISLSTQGLISSKLVGINMLYIIAFSLAYTLPNSVACICNFLRILYCLLSILLCNVRQFVRVPVGL